jgi:hypothetical protein
LHRCAHDFAFFLRPFLPFFLASASSSLKPSKPSAARIAANPPAASRPNNDRLEEPASANDNTKLSKRFPSIPCLLAVRVDPRFVARYESNQCGS